MKMYHRHLKRIYDSTRIAGNNYSDDINLEMSVGFCTVIQIEIDNPVDLAFQSTDIVNFNVAKMFTGYKTGLKVKFTTTGTLPTGLVAGVDYYITVADNLGFSVANSKVNAMNGVFINITGGSGTHTVNVQPFTVASVNLQASIDGVIYATLTNSSVQMSKADTVLFELNLPLYKNIRLNMDVDSGQVIVIADVLLKGDF